MSVETALFIKDKVESNTIGVIPRKIMDDGFTKSILLDALEYHYDAEVELGALSFDELDLNGKVEVKIIANETYNTTITLERVTYFH